MIKYESGEVDFSGTGESLFMEMVGIVSAYIDGMSEKTNIKIDTYLDCFFPIFEKLVRSAFNSHNYPEIIDIPKKNRP